MGTHIFQTPYDGTDAMNGEECSVIGELERGGEKLLVIEFTNGAKVEVWPEEIKEKSCPSPTPPPSERETT